MFDFLRKDNVIINIMIILVAVSPAFALGDGNRNMLLIGAMCLSPYFFFRYPIIIPKVDIPLILLCFMMVGFPLVFHPETMRWSTVLYSCLFCIYFMAFARVLSMKEYNLTDFAQLIKGLIYAYCIVLIIQQFCVLFGLPIFNVSNYSLKEPWKLNTLMSEPSHSARIIPVLMYIFICCKDFAEEKAFNIVNSIRNQTKVWIAFLWSILTMGSSTGFLFFFIVIAKGVSLKKIISSLIILTIALSVMYFSENKTIQRVKRLTIATFTLDEYTILRSDGSGAYRIVPSIRGAKKVSFQNFNGWFGHGIDADSKDIAPLPGTNTGHAGSFYLWYNYGLIVSFFFWIISFRYCFIANDIVSTLVWFLCIFMYGGLNNQIIWLTLILLYTYKLLIKNGTKTSMECTAL